MSEARRILGRAEAIDAYQSLCKESGPNRIARKGDLYEPYFLPAHEANRLRNLIRRIPLLNNCEVIVLHSSADNGYPHTRPEAVVCMPENSIIGVSDEELSETLRHEAMHIHQRRFPDAWVAKSIREGWTPVKLERIPLRFRELCRLNPDTFYATPFWAWEKHSVPLPMFKTAQPNSLGDMRIEWYDLRTGAVFHDAPPSFVARYGNAFQIEHPYELLAVEFAAKKYVNETDVYIELIK